MRYFENVNDILLKLWTLLAIGHKSRQPSPPGELPRNHCRYSYRPLGRYHLFRFRDATRKFRHRSTLAPERAATGQQQQGRPRPGGNRDRPACADANGRRGRPPGRAPPPFDRLQELDGNWWAERDRHDWRFYPRKAAAQRSSQRAAGGAAGWPAASGILPVRTLGREPLFPAPGAEAERVQESAARYVALVFFSLFLLFFPFPFFFFPFWFLFFLFVIYFYFYFFYVLYSYFYYYFHFLYFICFFISFLFFSFLFFLFLIFLRVKFIISP